MHGSFSVITKYIHYVPILRPGPPEFQPHVNFCPRIPPVELLGHSAALHLSREDLGCRGELSFELILGQKVRRLLPHSIPNLRSIQGTQPNRAPGFPFVYKKWHTPTYLSLNHPPPTSLLLPHPLANSLPFRSSTPHCLGALAHRRLWGERARRC